MMEFDNKRFVPLTSGLIHMLCACVRVCTSFNNLTGQDSVIYTVLTFIDNLE